MSQSLIYAATRLLISGYIFKAQKVRALVAPFLCRGWSERQTGDFLRQATGQL